MVAPLEWSSFFKAGELEALGLGIALPRLEVADPREALILHSAGGAEASAWVSSLNLGSITLAHAAVAAGKFTSLTYARRLMLHELVHALGEIPHDFAFATALEILFLRHDRRNHQRFQLREYDGHQDGRPVDEVLNFAKIAGAVLADDKRSMWDLLPELQRMQAKSWRTGLAAVMPRPRSRFFSFLGRKGAA